MSEILPQIAEMFLMLLFILILISMAYLVVLYFIDKTQSKSTLRRNYPVIARFRYLFEHLGEFFRQYFFALDREELPFNRAERSWVYRAAKDVDRTVAFGSTRNIKAPGTVYFLNACFPPLEKDAAEISEIVIGEECKYPYKSKSFFNISAMSYGSLSVPALQALSKGANKAGIWLNTGEGGLSKYHLSGDCDIVFQIGTAKFGVRALDGGFDKGKLTEIGKNKNVKMFEIKLSQGAKPGKGGMLPGDKVTKEIAEIRGIREGEDAISPNRHPEIENVSDLLDMVDYIRKITGKPTGFKMVVGEFGFFEDLAKEIKKRGIKSAPDFITIDGAGGGTGAAPMSLIDNVGLPLSESLPEVVNILEKHKLKERIKIIASGKLISPTEVAWALCAGADFINSARGFLFALGCIQAMKCNKNTCPTGITTHDKSLQRGLVPREKSLRVANYTMNVQKEVCMIAHSCGVSEPRKLSRKHARIVMPDGYSVSMEELYRPK